MPLMKATGIKTADERDRDYRRCHLSHGAVGGIARRKAALDPALDVLDDDNRVVNDDPDRQHQPEQRQVVQ